MAMAQLPRFLKISSEYRVGLGALHLKLETLILMCTEAP